MTYHDMTPKERRERLLEIAENYAVDEDNETAEFVQAVAKEIGSEFNEMTFGDALETLKFGGRVQRAGWNGKGMWLELQVPDEHSKMTLPYIYMSTAHGSLVPWLASQTDMIAEDWRVFPS